MRRLPPIHCLQTFEKLAQTRNVGKTADALCISQSAVSHRMKLLQSIVKEKLFDGANYSLTECGMSYLEVVSKSLRLLQSHQSDVS
jgi:LysR family transcriptional regulator, glycine cleavage system transcriptional activator